MFKKYFEDWNTFLSTKCTYKNAVCDVLAVLRDVGSCTDVRSPADMSSFLLITTMVYDCWRSETDIPELTLYWETN